MRTPAKIAEALIKAPSILLTSHLNPDGDALGSLLALENALSLLGKRALVVSTDPLPPSYRFLPGAEKLLLPAEVKSIPEVVVFCDCTEPQRAGEEFGKRLVAEAKLVINIDHHISNTFFGQLNYVRPGEAATAVLVFEVIKALKVPLNREMATALYTGIVTDTGSFQYENTSPRTLALAAKLLAAGANLALIRRHLWEEKSAASLRLLGCALSTLSFAAGGKIAWISLKEEEVSAFKANNGVLEELAEYPRSCAGVEVGLFFHETERGVVKVSLRSKDFFDVNALAQKFGGGGHPRAAGCTVKGSLPEVISKVVAEAAALLAGKS